MRLGSIRLLKPLKALYGPAGERPSVERQFQATFQHGNQECIETVFVVNGLKSNLLGLPAIRTLHLIASLNSVDEYRRGIYKHFPTLFHGLGNFGDEYQIKLRPDAKPFALYTARHVPIPLREQVKTELERMESIGVISPVIEPTDWCAGMVVVPRKNSTVRICVDLRPLSESVLREVHPLPKIDGILQEHNILQAGCQLQV